MFDKAVNIVHRNVVVVMYICELIRSNRISANICMHNVIKHSNSHTTPTLMDNHFVCSAYDSRIHLIVHQNIFYLLANLKFVQFI